MANQYVNKVVVNGQTQLDLTGDTVDAAHLAQGFTAHDKSGATITGTMEEGSGGEYDIESVDNGDGTQTLNISDASGGGSTGRLIFSDYDSDGLPHTMEYVPASPQDTKLPDRFCSYGHSYTLIGWFSKIDKVICPNHITELGIGGFGINKVAKSISNYDYLRILGNGAFGGEFNNLIYDYLPPNLEYVGNNGFDRNPLSSGLTFTLPNSLYYIGDSGFQYYSIENRPTYLVLPIALEHLGKSAFYNNGFQLFSTEEIIIPENVDYIGDTCFGGSAYKTKSLRFLGKPSTIGTAAFNYGSTNGTMKALTSIKVPWAEGEVANAPWGATNATITYNYHGGE